MKKTGLQTDAHCYDHHVLDRITLNLTSTKNREWEADCEAFRLARKPFELRDVTKEDEEFVEAFQQRHGWRAARKGKVVLFSPT